jgi:tartrate dehydrogenase/decarboxylase/D-malate dehydrogenase
MTTHRIAAIAGDGIGTEVMPEGLRVLDAAARRFGIALQVDEFDFANCAYYAKHGKMMPDDWKERIGGHDAIFFGAVGWPATVPDHVSLWGSLLKFRREFDQYVNLRPARLMPGIRSPLVDRQGQPLKPGDIDMWIVRENTEGEYSEIGGRLNRGTEQEIAIQEAVFTRGGVDRILRYAFALAEKRRRHVTSATKSNGIIHTMPFWDERFAAVAAEHPQVKADQYHIDILTAHFVRHPDWFDVVVGSNLFGDILSDLGPAVAGGIGIAPSANLDPTRTFPSMFEPVHGSAPDIAGKGIANPVGQIWSAAMMLDHFGAPEAARAVERAIETALADGVKTPDLGGTASTQDVGKAVAAALAAG